MWLNLIIATWRMMVFKKTDRRQFTQVDYRGASLNQARRKESGAMTNIGIIGYGYWGPNLARNFAEMPGVNLAAIADLDEAKLEVVRRRYPAVKTSPIFRICSQTRPLTPSRSPRRSALISSSAWRH